jgi:hypothetical protein
LDHIEFDGRTLALEIDAESGVSYTTHFVGSRNAESLETGIVFATTEGASATYELRPEDLFVRATVISDRIKENPYVEGELERAWIQPVTKNGS